MHAMGSFIISGWSGLARKLLLFTNAANLLGYIVILEIHDCKNSGPCALGSRGKRTLYPRKYAPEPKEKPIEIVCPK
jgi:hypothetical protein